MWRVATTARSFLVKVDYCGLLMVLVNNIRLLMYTNRNSTPAAAAAATGSAGDVQYGIVLVLLLAAVQFLSMLKLPEFCRHHRHRIALGNR
jgi:hypothetical protein